MAANGITGISHRNKLIQNINQMLCGNDTFMNLIVEQIQLSSGRSTNIIDFSKKDMILHIFIHPQNLLLDPNDPLSDSPESGYYGEVNTSTWLKEAKCNEYTQPNHILMPFCHLIDGFRVDKYRKLTIETVLTLCMWFNRKERNQASAWWVQRFVQDQKLFRNQKYICAMIKLKIIMTYCQQCLKE